MPIYEYSCTACNHAFDMMQKMSDDPVRICPECSKKTVVRLVSAAGFQLKGSGWYETDYKRKPKPESTDGTQSKEKATPDTTNSSDTKGTNDTSKSTETKKD